MAASDETPVAPQSKDNRVKAIIFMNFFALGAIGQSVVFKIAIADGAQVIDYQVFRNLSILFFSSIEMGIIKKNPFKLFPWD